MTPTGAEPAKVFIARHNTAPQAFAFILGGIAFFLVLLIYFLALIRRPARPGDDMIPGTLGGASVIGVALLMRGIFLLRATTRVLLDSTAVHLETHLSRRSIPWSNIDHIQRDKRSPLLGSVTHQIIQFIGKSGKPLASIADTIADFDLLAAEVTARSASAAGHTTYDPSADEIRRNTRQSKKLKLVAWGFLTFAVGMAAALCFGIDEEIHTRRFASEAVHADAKILRHWMVHVTPHVEYSFRDAQGRTYTKDAMMWQGPDWDSLNGQSTVPIEYLPSDPTWNRLVTGEDPGPQFSGNFLLLLIAGTLMFSALSVVAFLGFDLRSEHGLTTLTRHGRVLKSWGHQTKASSP